MVSKRPLRRKAAAGRAPRNGSGAPPAPVWPAEPGTLQRARVLILAPTGRDGVLLHAALGEAAIHARVCRDMAELCGLFREGAGAAIVAEEALTQAAVRCLRETMADEPFWSDLPLIVLTGRQATAIGGMRTIEQLGALGNVTVLPRPMERAILVRHVRVALRARERQYDRRRVADALEASLREKDVLLREIHHRVKNNLQIISSLLSLQADAFEDRTIISHFQDSQARIHSMALVHEKLYGTADLSSIDMRGYAEGLVSHLSRTYGLPNVEVIVEVEPLVLGIDLAIPCGLMLNELITNAFKYAFPDGRPGRITLSLRNAGGEQLSLSVSDDGVGLPAGVDPVQTRSLGLRLVDALVRQVNGRLAISRGPGAAFTVTFPANGRQAAAVPAN